MSVHKSVLLDETIEKLSLKPGQKIVDCTLGGGGHTKIILDGIGDNGELLAIDQDEKAVEAFKAKAESLKQKTILVNDNFDNLEDILQKNKFLPVDGILADFGFSSDQIEDDKRGLSFMRSGPLDMRYGKNQSLTAEDIVNGYSRDELVKIFKEYGEEPLPEKIAKAIAEARRKERITTTSQLADVISGVKSRRGKMHPATQVFQALRIEVNDELGVIERFLPQAVKALKPGGRLAIITFHSLEDRIVKRFFKKISLNTHACRVEESGEKKGSPDSSTDFKVKLINKKVIKPSWDEVKVNRRARSAKLRVVERI
jgi:16S rRNA (cytosine1402-N4)-methyltransferase